MDASGYEPCDVAYHISCLRRDGEALADAATLAGLDAPVPACPDWQVRDLLKHIGYVHRWAATYVTERHDTWVDRSSEQDILRQGRADGALVDWFCEGHGRLVAALEAADPALTCWTFLDAPSPLAFWARRQAHETAMHRVDAQQAAAAAGGQTTPIEPRFAADGVDELVMGFVGRESRRGSWDGPAGTLAFHADDGHGQAHWRIEAGDGKVAVSREDGPAGFQVTAPAADLYLLLWNRRPADGLAVTGDPGLLAAFCREFTVTWT